MTGKVSRDEPFRIISKICFIPARFLVRNRPAGNSCNQRNTSPQNSSRGTGPWISLPFSSSAWRRCSPSRITISGNQNAPRKTTASRHPGDPPVFHSWSPTQHSSHRTRTDRPLPSLPAVPIACPLPPQLVAELPLHPHTQKKSNFRHGRGLELTSQ